MSDKFTIEVYFEIMIIRPPLIFFTFEKSPHLNSLTDLPQDDDDL
jgi:hypothetical protein